VIKNKSTPSTAGLLPGVYGEPFYNMNTIEPRSATADSASAAPGRPQIWHYGLVAREWGESSPESEREAAYFQSVIQTSGQPALDLGCGSGRVLIPLLRAGLQVDGCDYSADMLAQCAARARHAGLAPQLYQQSMHELDLAGRYRTIFACGVIGLGINRRQTLQAMQRVYDHLRPGGVFVFDYWPRWNDPPAWLNRLPDSRHALPQEWPESSERTRLSDGTELEMASRTIAMDPLEDVAIRQMRGRLWRDGVLLTEEIHTQRVMDFSKHELLLMLERAGFGQIKVNGEYSDRAATADDEVILFLAQK
jgi:SAM-dependent methyltransferase